MSPEALSHARVIFDYHQLLESAPGDEVADVMIVLGTNDTRVAEVAADLFHRGMARTVIPTGGIAHQNDLLSTAWDRPEAEVFGEILIGRGVPREAILLETAARNTAQNIAFTRRLMADRGLEASCVRIVCKPFMRRRVAATLAVEWPEVPAEAVSSWKTTFDDYCLMPDLPQQKVANIIMGDLQRLWVYARKGYSAPQELPDGVKVAFESLARMGFTRHLIE